MHKELTKQFLVLLRMISDIPVLNFRSWCHSFSQYPTHLVNTPFTIIILHTFFYRLHINWIVPCNSQTITFLITLDDDTVLDQVLA